MVSWIIQRFFRDKEVVRPASEEAVRRVLQHGATPDCPLCDDALDQIGALEFDAEQYYWQTVGDIG